MQTSLEVEGLLTTPQPLTAANEEFARQAQSAAPAGWDPFEVWRTRVKAAAAQDSTKPATSIA